MAFDFHQYLVIGISSRALFDLEAENRIFEQQGLEAYSRYQLEHEDNILEPGVAFPLVEAILNLNQVVPSRRRVEIVVMSKNNADTKPKIR